ncbi:MAG: hypothetical protein ACXW2U_09705 [Telluria sp.]
MTNNSRWKFHFCLGLAGLGLTAYLTYLGLQSQAARNDSSTLPLLVGTGICLLVAGGINFYMAFGFHSGWVDEVRGSGDSATLIRRGKIFRANVRIRLIRRMDEDDLNVPDDQRPVFFLGDGFPWVCSTKNFRYNSKRETE